jgi:THO complex subunit 3
MPPPKAKSLPRTILPTHLTKLKTTVYDDLPPSSRAFPPAHAIRTLAWSPLGSLVATGSADRTMRVWNPERNQARHSTELKGHGGAVERVVWHPRHEAEVASVCADGAVRFWDVRTRGAVGRVEVGEGAFTGAWRADGDELVVGRKVSFVLTE